MSFTERSLLGRVCAFMVDHVATCFPAGERGSFPTAADLEQLARAELQAQIDKGRPGPEEARRTRPRPLWATPRPRASKPLDVVAVRLDVLPPPVPTGMRARKVRREPAG